MSTYSRGYVHLELKAYTGFFSLFKCIHILAADCTIKTFSKLILFVGYVQKWISGLEMLFRTTTV